MGQFVTPIIESSRHPNQNHIYIKRDDLYPVALGGNKARIAEAMIEDALKKGCSHIVSYGSVTSNMNRAVAVLCGSRHLRCTVICPQEENLAEKSGNSVIVQTCGAHIVRCTKDKVAETVEQVCQRIKENGEQPYYIYGNKYGKGNEVTTSKVYIDVYHEILEQEKHMKMNFDYIFHATGTGMTQAGLIVGNCMNQKKHRIVGISIARDKDRELPVLVEKVKQFSEIMDGKSFDADDFILYDKAIGTGYGQADDSLNKTIREELCLDGIPLDITYTGKAFMGMLRYIEERDIHNKNILFIHTGGTPLFFDNLQEIMQI